MWAHPIINSHVKQFVFLVGGITFDVIIDKHEGLIFEWKGGQGWHLEEVSA